MDEEREKERLSQESSRPSMDSIRRDVTDNNPTTLVDSELSRRIKPTLDTVAERKSEYLDNVLVAPVETKSQHLQRSESPAQVQPINTNVLQAPSFPSASSKYTDRPDPVSASTVDSRFPSRHQSQYDDIPPNQSRQLPQISRASTFGSDFLHNDNNTPVRQPDHPPPPPPKDLPGDLQHKPSVGYRSMVSNAFQSQNQAGSPTPTNTSILRSNTMSTSEISPIVGPSRESAFDRALTENTARENNFESQRLDTGRSDDNEAYYAPPQRLGTNRRDSGSPARRPLSMAAPDIPEPQSAITSPYEEPIAAKNPAKEAQIIRPGPAILVQQKAPSKENVHDQTMGDSQASASHLRKQGSHLSEVSDISNQRTASEEWDKWSAEKNAAHARHGIQDSNPTTPGLDTAPAPPFETLDKNVHMPARSEEDKLKPLSVSSGLASQRPQVQRDESFRPHLPGGWMSSQSIQKEATMGPLSSVQPRPAFADLNQRTESMDSVPTAKAPRDANWRSQYSGTQAQAFAAAATAGSALAGSFSGPALTTGTNTESEVSSINEPDEGPTGLHRDPSMSTRDFAATPEVARVSKEPASGNIDAPVLDQNDVTPRARQEPFPASQHGKTAPIITGLPEIKRQSIASTADESPSKDSEERWWSDGDEVEPVPQAPPPLRTNRLSTVEPTRPAVSPIRGRSDSDSGPDANQLESDIVKSLTPKSSSIADTQRFDDGRVSPLREKNLRPVSPPFAAAALAVSPGREYKAIQEQNTFQPLSAPHSRSESAEVEKLPSLDTSRPQMQPTRTDRQTTPILTQSLNGQDGVVASPLAESTPTKAVADVQSSKPPRSATKEFAIYDDFPVLPSVASTQHLAETNAQSRNIKTANTRASPTVTQYPAKVTANEAVTVSAEENETSGGSPSHNQNTKALKNETLRPVTVPGTTATGPVMPVTKTQVSAPPSPITPHSIKQPPWAISTSYDPNRSFPREKVPVANIVGMDTAQGRIRAYNENREAYAEPVGHLENWLAHMHTAEHADAFTTKPISTAPYTASGPRSSRRDSNGMPSGRQQMQEDGKRFIASATKYGQKAGVLGKGLFSKGKEKLRTVSAGQKVAR